jgi:hypothetical protein
MCDKLRRDTCMLVSPVKVRSTNKVPEHTNKLW